MLAVQRFRGVPFAGSIPAHPDNHVSYFDDRMTATKHLSRLFALLAVIAVLALILGQVLGQPILLGYVATGSMEPTLDAGDGFIAVPSVLTGSASEGDVVVFDARTLHDGGLTTHRVVDVTDEGYHTHGDANPFTDQDGGEPPVSDGQIVAVALQVNGEVVRIPHLGTAVMTAHGAAETASGTVAGVFGLDSGLDAEGTGTVFVGIGVALLVFGLLLDHVGPKQRGLSRTRDRENVLSIWLALAVVLIVLVTLASATMVVPSGVHEYGLISTDEPTDDPQVVAPGETAEVTRTIDNSGLLPVVVIVEGCSQVVQGDLVVAVCSVEFATSVLDIDQRFEAGFERVDNRVGGLAVGNSVGFVAEVCFLANNVREVGDQSVGIEVAVTVDGTVEAHQQAELLGWAGCWICLAGSCLWFGFCFSLSFGRFVCLRHFELLTHLG